MAFKSEAQRRKFQELVQSGKITQKVFDYHEKDTKGDLPERAERSNNQITKKAALGPLSIPKPRSIEELKKILKK